MPPEILALIDKPVLLITILFVGVLAGMTVERLDAQQRRASWKRKNGWFWKHKASTTTGPGGSTLAPERPRDAADQLRTVMGAHFTIQPLLNKSEVRLFKELDRLVIARNPAWQVMAQVSLGEIFAARTLRPMRVSIQSGSTF